jgi:hypothetical protein
LLVLAAKTQLQESDVEEHINTIIKTREISDSSVLSTSKSMMLDSISHKSQEELKIWNQKQLYIAV